MSFIWVLLISVVAISVLFFLIGYSILWFSRRAVKQFAVDYADVEVIINQKRVPDAWLEPFRQRISEVRQKGGTPREIQQVSEASRRKVVKRLKQLHSSFSEGNFYDCDDTKLMVIEAIKAEYECWQNEPVEVLFAERTGLPDEGTAQQAGEGETPVNELPADPHLS